MHGSSTNKRPVLFVYDSEPPVLGTLKNTTQKAGHRWSNGSECLDPHVGRQENIFWKLEETKLETMVETFYLWKVPEHNWELILEAFDSQHPCDSVICGMLELRPTEKVDGLLLFPLTIHQGLSKDGLPQNWWFLMNDSYQLGWLLSTTMAMDKPTSIHQTCGTPCQAEATCSLAKVLRGEFVWATAFVDATSSNRNDKWCCLLGVSYRKIEWWIMGKITNNNRKKTN